MTDNITQKIMNVNDLLINYLLNNKNNWIPDVEKAILNQSNGKYRVFHIFFNNVKECLSGKFHIEVLDEKDIIAMYPKLLNSSSNVENNKFMYIFHCNDAISKGQGLTCDTII